MRLYQELQWKEQARCSQHRNAERIVPELSDERTDAHHHRRFEHDGSGYPGLPLEDQKSQLHADSPGNICEWPGMLSPITQAWKPLYQQSTQKLLEMRAAQDVDNFTRYKSLLATTLAHKLAHVLVTFLNEMLWLLMSGHGPFCAFWYAFTRLMCIESARKKTRPGTRPLFSLQWETTGARHDFDLPMTGVKMLTADFPCSDFLKHSMVDVNAPRGFDESAGTLGDIIEYWRRTWHLRKVSTLGESLLCWLDDNNKSGQDSIPNWHSESGQAHRLSWPFERRDGSSLSVRFFFSFFLGHYFSWVTFIRVAVESPLTGVLCGTESILDWIKKLFCEKSSNGSRQVHWFIIW